MSICASVSPMDSPEPIELSTADDLAAETAAAANALSAAAAAVISPPYSLPNSASPPFPPLPNTFTATKEDFHPTHLTRSSSFSPVSFYSGPFSVIDHFKQ